MKSFTGPRRERQPKDAHDGEIPRGRTQRMQLQAEAERENSANPSNLSQPERLRWALADAANGKSAGRN